MLDRLYPGDLVTLTISGDRIGLVLDYGVRIFDDGVEALVAWADSTSTWESAYHLELVYRPEDQ